MVVIQESTRAEFGRRLTWDQLPVFLALVLTLWALWLEECFVTVREATQKVQIGLMWLMIVSVLFSVLVSQARYVQLQWSATRVIIHAMAVELFRLYICIL